MKEETDKRKKQYAVMYMIKINEPQLPRLRTAIYHTGLDVKMEVTQCAGRVSHMYKLYKDAYNRIHTILVHSLCIHMYMYILYILPMF